MTKKSNFQKELGIKEIGRYLQDLREARGVTQRQIANALGYSTPQFVSNWERGLSMLPANDMPKILKLYGADVDKVYSMTLKYEIGKIKSEVHEKIFGKPLKG